MFMSCLRGFCPVVCGGKLLKDIVQGQHLIGLNKLPCNASAALFSSGQSGQRVNLLSSDLKRFLEEVGTDPREARFWLRQFQHRDADLEQPFAVLQIESSTLRKGDVMEMLCSSLSFLHRNGMPVVLVHGPDPNSYCDGSVYAQRQELLEQEMHLVDCLEKCYGTTRTFCGSSGIIYSKQNDSSRKYAGIENMNVDPIKWTIRSRHIPMLTSLSIDHQTGIVTPLCPKLVAVKLSELLKPIKVIFLNDTGGLVNEFGKVISNIKIPGDIPSISGDTYQIDEIVHLLKNLPDVSSAVITSPDKIIKELFTHQGSGTIFQKTETINCYKSLKDVDVPRFTKLLTQSFRRPLKQDYIEIVEKHLCSVYITESYSAAAVVIQDKENCEIPYLDKFVISSTSQGQGTSEALWALLRRDFQSLFWRSRTTNKINPWYFIRANGSWTDNDWIIFWYGVSEPKLSQSLVKFAGNLPASFDPIAKHDDTLELPNRSTTSYIQYV